MGRSSIMLLLTLAVLLQPAFASVCMMQCPPVTVTQAAQPVAGHGSHAHHHATTPARSQSLAFRASGVCDKTIDLRSSALLSPVAPELFIVSKGLRLQIPARALSLEFGITLQTVRFNAPIVVPLRI